MRARGFLLAGIPVAAVAVAAVVAAIAWPSIEDRAARTIESRLREETGRPWRIESVSLSLRPTPQIVLKNLAVGDDRAGSGVFGARIREVRLTDAVSLVFGSGNSGHAVADGVSLRAPIAAQPGAAANAPADAPAAAAPSRKGGAVRINLQGVDGGLTESGRAVTVSAQTLDLVFDRAAPQDRTEIRANAELPTAVATLSIDLPVAGEASGPFKFTLDPRAGKGHRVEANAKASLKPATLKLDAVTGKIDGEGFTGGLEVGWGGAKPRIALDARLDALTLTDEKDAARLEGGGLVVPVTPDVIPDVRWFSSFEGGGSLKVARLTLGPVRLEKVEVGGSIKGNGLDAALASASGYEGSMRGRYVLAPDADGAGRHQIGFSVKGMRVRPLLADIAGSRGIDGSGNLRVDLQAKGVTVEELRRSLAGSADLSVTDGRIDGLDIIGMIGLISSDAARRASQAARLERLGGTFSLAEGQAVTNDLELKTALIEAKGIGSIDLIGRTLDIRLKPQVIAPGAGRPSGSRNPLDIPIQIVGPWDNPSVSANLAGIANNPSGVIESLQDLGHGLFGGGGGGGGKGNDLGGLIDGFLGGRPDRRRPRSFDDRDSPR